MMKPTWILPAAALTVGAVGGFMTGKITSVATDATIADSPSVMQTRAGAGSRSSATDQATATRGGGRATSMEDIYRSPGNLSRLENLMRYYGSLSAEQLRDEADKLDDLPLNERMPASFLLFARWAEMDPHGAMEYSNSMGMRGAFVRPTILQSWASVDPENAARYYSANPGQFALMNMGRGMGGQDGASIIATEWARQDSQGALSWANSLTHGKSDALAAVLGEVAKSDPEQAAQMLDQLDPDDRVSAYASIAGRYGAKDFGAAEAWIRTLPHDQQSSALASAIEGLAGKSPSEALTQINRMPDGDAKNQIIPSLMGPMGRSNPEGAAALILAQSDPEIQRESLRELIPVWTAQDPAAALAFASARESGPVYDRAMSSFITSNTAGNPTEMMRLAETIEDDRERGWSVGFTAQRWMQSDPDAARTYIQQTDAIPENMRERLLDGRPMWGGRGRR